MKGIHPNSILAYWEGNDELLGKRREKVVAVLRASRDALTDREVMTKLGFIDPNAVRPRITELVEAGIVRETGSTECPVTRKRVRTVALVRNKPEAQFEMAEILTPAVLSTLNQRTA